MADDEVIETAGPDAPEPERRRSTARKVLRGLGFVMLALVLLVGVAIAWLHTGSGRQFVVDQIADVAPASGLTVEVGRIEGSVLWSATLFDVKLRDAKGKLFLEVPEVDLNWRPLKFFVTGLDVRHLVLHGGTFYAAPELLPGDPDAPILPDFDIRVDRFVVDDLHIAEGLLGDERVVDFRAKADIRDGRVLLDARGDFGGGDRLVARIDAEPDGNRFDMDVDYRAPAGGLLAMLVGAEDDLRARLVGEGTWQKWDGAFVVNQGGAAIGAFKVYNRGGRYKIVGQARPEDYLTGLPAQALGEVVSLAAIGTLEDSVLDGSIALRGRGVALDGAGAIDLADNAFEGVETRLVLLDSELFGPGLSFRDFVARATFDGPFRGFTAPLELSIGRADFGGTVFANLVQRGTLSYDGKRWRLPLDAAVDRVTSGNALIDPRLVNGRLRGLVTLADSELRSDDLELRFPGLQADLTLRGDIERGGYALAGPVEMRGLALENLGTVDAGAKILFTIGSGVPWTLQANFTGRMPRVTNATLANLAGSNIRFNGGVTLGAARPIAFDDLRVTASKLSLLVDGRVENGRTTLAGSGRHADYGPFTVEAALAGDGPRATLVFANPYPAAGLSNVRVALAPTRDGFRIDAEGQSLLGPFDGLLDLTMPAGGPTQIAIRRLDVWRTSVTGTLTLAEGGAAGTLALAGGGVNGTIRLAPRNGGQGFDVALTANNARFAGPTPLAINQATVNVSGYFGQGNSTIEGTVRAAGINYGTLFIGRMAANAQVVNGRGTFQASLAGRRGSRFNVQLAGDVAPERIAVAARGDYAGREIVMPRRAVLLKTADGGWALQKTQLSFGNGFAIAEGRFGGSQPAQGKLSLASMPLSLLDAFAGDIGLGGTISGVIDVGAGPNGVPTGEARVMVDNLTRSGLVLSSRPIDLALVARLSPSQLQARAVLQDEGQTKGRLQARISGLPAAGALADRLYAGDLFAQLRFEGPADALWRLSTIELIDVTGTMRVAADVTGTLRNPRVRGSLAGDALRVQSAVTGSDIREVRARGTFSGSRLNLTSFAGTSPNGGRVTGSGFVDLSDMTRERGPRIDLRLAMRDAEVMDLANMGATVTGPMRIVSSGVGGTIAGRLQVNEARWQLGAAAATQRLPNIRTREVNLPPDIQQAAAPGAPWRYLIDAAAPGGIEVDGMGLDSEWSAEIRLRGTTENPRIGGEARVVPRQGFYNFAGTRFEITRGVIDFDESSPPDPRLNIRAETEVQDLSVAVTVTGNSSRPLIDFTSVPALPEEELLARILFGDSITSLSATDALQLGAAVASLRGGGGMDPINRLRTAIGLDRLRIVPADAALDRGTAIALGKNFGRRFYVEIVTDGKGYNATELEFRVTSWLSLLASVNTIGRHSVAAEYSRDY
ncbi:MAG TPA: translocation/assembly module TamB domain-containing protein [Croceibacterium sp.]|nr:translocation/assembly module TamB domain-containing protein [Croceibacterium sp.]